MCSLSLQRAERAETDVQHLTQHVHSEIDARVAQQVARAINNSWRWACSLLNAVFSSIPFFFSPVATGGAPADAASSVDGLCARRIGESAAATCFANSLFSSSDPCDFSSVGDCDFKTVSSSTFLSTPQPRL